MLKVIKFTDTATNVTGVKVKATCYLDLMVSVAQRGGGLPYKSGSNPC